jgi:MYXO-CTERM domain-containing protein
MTYVQTNLGVTPIIYTNTNYATNYLESDISQYPLWLANWNYAPPSVPPSSADGVFRGWSFWQYADSGTVPGIGSVDHDVYRGTLDQMLSAFQGVKPTGDINNDGQVDGKDLLLWQRNLGRTGTAATFARGNANGDGTIDAADLAVIQSQWGTAGVVSAASAVPEPAGAALAVVGLLAAVRARRRK